VEAKLSSNPRSYAAYLASRPRQCEHQAIELLVRICREYRCAVHIVHLSSADALPIIEAAQLEDLPLTVETCPHYLYFASEEIPDGDPRFKCAPPIRERENRERLWRGLKEGPVAFIASDHSPAPPEMKQLATGNLQQAWGGIASLQLSLSVVWTAASRHGAGLGDVQYWMCGLPPWLVGLWLRKGMLIADFDADLVVFDPDAEFTVTPEMLQQRHKVTPYEGCKLRGRVDMTFLRGRKVYDAGRFPGEPSGCRLLRRGDSVLGT
jgi:allantoinase